MPERRGEWIVFVLALCALGVLAALIFLRATHRPMPLVHKQGTATVVTTAAPTTAVTRTVGTPTVDGGTTTPPGGRGAAHLVLTASRGDSWIAIRAGSAHGDVLFEGILAKGQTQTFSEPVLWASFGAASNVDAQLNGQPLGLPAGTVRVVITPQGVG